MRALFATMSLVAASLPVAAAPAADPDTFDPATRDPAWLSPRVREAQARRAALAARWTDDWLDRCARYLEEWNGRLMRDADERTRRRSAPTRPPRAADEGEELRQLEETVAEQQRRWEAQAEAARSAARLEGEDVQVCFELERSYYEARRDLLRAAWGAVTGPSNGRADGSQRLSLFQRQYGAAAVVRLERRAAAFNRARAALGPELVEPADELDVQLDPAQPPAERAQAAVRAAVARVATPQLLDLYLRLRLRLADDPRLPKVEPALPGLPSFVPPVLPQDGTDPREALRRHRQGVRRSAEVEQEIAASLGLSSADRALLQAMLDGAREHRRTVAWETDAPEKTKRLEEWEAFRGAVGPAIADFFDAHVEDWDRRLDTARTDAELARRRPRPLKPRVDRTPLLRIRNVGASELPAFRVRVARAAGPAVLDCAADGRLDAPCLIAPDVLAARTRYRVSVEGLAPKPLQAQLQVDGRESRVTVGLDRDGPRLSVQRTLPAPPGVRLEPDGPATFERVAFRLVNGGERPLVPHGASWADAIRLEHDEGRDWAALPERPTAAPGDAQPLAPGASLNWEFGAHWLVSAALPPVLRAVVRLEGGSGASVAIEAASPSQLLVRTSRPGTGAETCVANYRKGKPVPQPGFTDLVAAPAGLLALARDGIVQVSGAEPRLHLASEDALLSFAASADRRLVAAHGWHTVLLSRDGGTTFARLEAGVGDPAALAFSGDELWVFGVEGAAARVGDDGVARPVELPKKVTWHHASFDGAHGAVVGSCDTLLVTADGGRTWSERRRAARSPLVRGSEILFVSLEGIFSSTDGGATAVLRSGRPCFRLRQARDRVLATCLPDGETRSPLLVSTPEGAFVPIPSEVPFSAAGAAITPDGRVHAVSRDGMLFSGGADGVQQRLATLEAKKALLAALRRPPPRVVPKPRRPPEPPGP